MIQDNLNGYLPEQESWKYILRVIQDETIFFKTKLAHILSNDFEKEHLRHLEIFQHRFLKMDEQVELLRHELSELQDIMQKSNWVIIHPEKMTQLQKSLAIKMDGLKESFDILSSDFRTYLRQFRQ